MSDTAIRRDRIPLGIAYMLAATVMFQLSFALSKWLTQTYPFGEILWFTCWTGFLICIALFVPVKGWAVFRTAKPLAHVGRGVAQSIALSFIVIALSLMPVAGAAAINFSAPLFAAATAMLVYRERVDASRIGALVVGFIGVLIVTQPGAGTLQTGALFALANAVTYGAITAAVRGLSKTESAETLTTWQMFVMGTCLTVTLPFGFVTPDATGFALLAANGVLNFLGQFLWSRALLHAPTSAVTPYYYFSLVWAIGLGFFIWGDVPTPSFLLGAAVVIASGLFLLWREARR